MEANGNGISATKADHSAMNNTTQAVGFTFIASKFTHFPFLLSPMLTDEKSVHLL
jgi:hypothetical protein